MFFGGVGRKRGTPVHCCGIVNQWIHCQKHYADSYINNLPYIKDMPHGPKVRHMPDKITVISFNRYLYLIFMETPCTIVNPWDQTKNPLIHEGTQKNLWHSHTKNYIQPLKKKMSFYWQQYRWTCRALCYFQYV